MPTFSSAPSFAVPPRNPSSTNVRGQDHLQSLSKRRQPDASSISGQRRSSSTPWSLHDGFEGLSRPQSKPLRPVQKPKGSRSDHDAQTFEAQHVPTVDDNELKENPGQDDTKLARCACSPSFSPTRSHGTKRPRLETATGNAREAPHSQPSPRNPKALHNQARSVSHFTLPPTPSTPSNRARPTFTTPAPQQHSWTSSHPPRFTPTPSPGPSSALHNLHDAYRATLHIPPRSQAYPPQSTPIPISEPPQSAIPSAIAALFSPHSRKRTRFVERGWAAQARGWLLEAAGRRETEDDGQLRAVRVRADVGGRGRGRVVLLDAVRVGPGWSTAPCVRVLLVKPPVDHALEVSEEEVGGKGVLREGARVALTPPAWEVYLPILFAPGEREKMVVCAGWSAEDTS